MGYILKDFWTEWTLSTPAPFWSVSDRRSPPKSKQVCPSRPRLILLTVPAASTPLPVAKIHVLPTELSLFLAITDHLRSVGSPAAFCIGSACDTIQTDSGHRGRLIGRLGNAFWAARLVPEVRKRPRDSRAPILRSWVIFVPFGPDRLSETLTL